MRVALGIVTFSLLGWAFVGTVRRRNAGDAANVGRRESLLEMLVDIEQRKLEGCIDSADYKRRRATLLDQLERIYESAVSPGADG